MSIASLADPWQRVSDELRTAILTGQLEPGSRLLEEQLAETFGVSRGPVREALRVLETQGLVIRKPRIGSMVVPLERTSVEEIYSLRSALEPFAIKRALTRNPGPLLVGLAAALADMRAAVTNHDTVALVEADLNFHTCFYTAAEHDRMARIWDSMRGPLRILIGQIDRRTTYEDPTMLGHETLYAAAAQGDIQACTDEIQRHLDAAEVLILNDAAL